MNLKLTNPLFLGLSFLVALMLYSPLMNGAPIWDDLAFWFQDPVMKPDFSYLYIWQKFSWPMSVSTQKVLFTLFDKNFIVYHLINILVHFGNSFLLYKLALRLRAPFPRFLFLLFLLHPANVISVGWMVQLKTLMCFFFGILSFYFLDRSFEQKKYFALSWILFLLSVLSKASSFPLPFLFLAYSFFQGKRKELLWLIPFFLISSWSIYRVLASPLTKQHMPSIQSHIFNPINAEVVPTISPVATPTLEASPVLEKMYPKGPKRNPWLIKTYTFMKTLHYYFWQTLLPLENQPVKGTNSALPTAIHFVHLFFLIILVLMTWKSTPLWFFLAGHLMLLPFLGLLPAPYMNVTWVSDQHLYLAIPFFLLFWLTLLNQWSSHKKNIPLFGVTLFFMILLPFTTPYYKDEIPFFEASLKGDPSNVPIAYNLATSYYNRGEMKKGFELTEIMIYQAEENRAILANKYYPYLFMLHLELQESMGPHEN